MFKKSYDALNKPTLRDLNPDVISAVLVLIVAAFSAAFAVTVCELIVWAGAQ